MILLTNIPLPKSTQDELADFQTAVNNEITYADRVAAAKSLFSGRNRKGNPTFRVVRSTLDRMCGETSRCHYCEDSFADEIEHIRPKDLYPEQVFVWENYLYACGPCNGTSKGSHFAVFEPASDHFIDVTRRRGDPIIPPTEGEYVFIDPRSENPLSYFKMDLSGTFFFIPIAPPGTREYQRARYTIDILRLNSRDALVKARESAFGSYKARLSEYREKRIKGANTEELIYLQEGFRAMDHPTVWEEMKRQQILYSELRALFQDIPEAMGW